MAFGDGRVGGSLEAEGRVPRVRSAECSPSRLATGRDHWERARNPSLVRYCDQLARAEALVESNPQKAIDAAAQAEELLPGRAAPLVVKGRALAQLGQFPLAAETLTKARSVDPLALSYAPALYALALSLRESQNRTGAVVVYRELLSRVAALSDVQRDRVWVETVSQVMAQGGADALDESITLARTGVQTITSAYGSILQGLLALALDRKGLKLEAAGVASEAVRAGALSELQSATGLSVVLRGVPDEQAALIARLREVQDSAGAAAAWDTFASSHASSPWVSHARAKAAELRKSAVAPKPRPNQR